MMVNLVAINSYTSDTPTVTLSSGANLVIACCFASNGDGSTLTNCTLGGSAYVDINTLSPVTGGEEAVLGAASFAHPGAGNYVLDSTFSGAGSVRSKQYVVIELSSAGAMAGFVGTALGGQANNFIASQDLTGAQNEFAIALACASDASTFETNGGSDYQGNLTNVTPVMRDYLQSCVGVDAVVAGDPETYQFQFTEATLGGGFYDRASIAVLYVTSTTEVNYYIDTDVVGGANNGTSWADAYSSMDTALSVRAQAINAGDKIIFNCRGTADDNLANQKNLNTLGWSGDGTLVFKGDLTTPYKKDTSKYYLKTASNYLPIYVDNACNLDFQNFQLENPSSNTGSILLYATSGADCPDITGTDCIFTLNREATTSWTKSPFLAGGSGTSSTSIIMTRCTFFGKNERIVGFGYFSGMTVTLDQCYVEEIVTSLISTAVSSTVTVQNSAINKTAGSYFIGQSATLENCATNDGAGNNPVTVTDWNAELTDITNYDATLLGSSQLLDAGIGGINIGPDQDTVGGGGATIPRFIYHYRSQGIL